MHNAFVSVVCLIRQGCQDLAARVHAIARTAAENFEDYEIILVDNASVGSCKETLAGLPAEVRRNIAIVHLANRVDYGNAIVAGLDIANGDYTFVVDTDIRDDQAALLVDCYKKATDENVDVVYLRRKHRKLSLGRRFFYEMFYWIMNRYSNVSIDLKMHQWRLISRRALNSALQIRDTSRYMKAVWAYVGYKSVGLDVELGEERPKDDSLKRQVRTAFVAITTFTDIVSRALLGCTLLAMMGALLSVTDAVLIKLRGFDLFGTPRAEIPGWSFLIVVMCGMFFLLFSVLYLMSLYLMAINHEVRRRPVYFLESIERV